MNVALPLMIAHGCLQASLTEAESGRQAAQDAADAAQASCLLFSPQLCGRMQLRVTPVDDSIFVRLRE